VSIGDRGHGVGWMKKEFNQGNAKIKLEKERSRKKAQTENYENYGKTVKNVKNVKNVPCRGFAFSAVFCSGNVLDILLLYPNSV
jgi:hypothetical protein